MYIELIYT